MTETDLHKFLKDVGMAYLYNQNCFLVATEVNVFPSVRLNNPLDNHFVVDVCGVGDKYIPQHLRNYEEKTVQIQGKPKIVQDYTHSPYKYNITRGLEVKVSRSDFKNGFVCSGCNYNYIMVPEGLLYSNEVPKGVGVVKVDVKNFHSSFHSIYKFDLQGVRVVRKPKFKEIRQSTIDSAIAHISRRSTRELMIKVAEKLEHNSYPSFSVNVD